MMKHSELVDLHMHLPNTKENFYQSKFRSDNAETVCYSTLNTKSYFNVVFNSFPVKLLSFNPGILR
jgi:hypothetical protein